VNFALTGKNPNPEQVSQAVVDLLLEQLAEFTTWHFSVWTPQVILSVSPSGDVTPALENLSGTVPWIAIKKANGDAAMTSQLTDQAVTAGGDATFTVTNASTGAGVPNVSVSVYDSSGSFLGSGRTNASGVYTVTGLPTGSYYVRTSNSSGLIDQLY